MTGPCSEVAFFSRDSLFSHVFGAFRQTKVALWGSQACSGKIGERSVFIYIHIYLHIINIYKQIFIYIFFFLCVKYIDNK